MKTKILNTPLGKLNLSFIDLTRVTVELPKSTPCEVNRVPLSFNTYYEFKDNKWQAENGYQSFSIPNKWGKEISRATRDKVHEKIIQVITTFTQEQKIFMLSVKLDTLQSLNDSDRRTQEDNLEKIKKLQEENLDLQSKIIGRMCQITESKESFQTKKTPLDIV